MVSPSSLLSQCAMALAIWSLATPIFAADGGFMPVALGSKAPAESEPASTFPAIKVAPTAKLQRDMRALHHAWAQRTLLGPCAAALPEAPWKKDALAFVEKAVDDLAYQSSTIDPRALAEEGQKLVEAGAQDPLIRYLTARLAFRHTGDAEATTKVLEDMTKRIEAEHTYGAALLSFIGKDAYTVRRSTGLTGKGREKGMNELMKKSLTDGSYGPEDDAVFVLHQLDPQWRDMPESRAAAFLEYYNNPAIPEWARHTLRGHCEVTLAWEDRGGDTADNVKQEGWEGFGAHLKKATAELTEGWKLRPDQPYAAAAMIMVAMGGGAEEADSVRLWFERAVAAQFDYYPAYRSVLWAYRPRWGGSHALMIAFGRACRQTARFDTIIPLYFREAVHDVLSETTDQRLYLREHPALTRELMDLDRDLSKNTGPAGSPELWRTKLAIDAWCMGDLATAREAAATLPHGIVLAPSNLRELRTSSREIMADLALTGSPAGQARDKAEEAYQKGNLAAARASFTKALETSEGEAAAWLSGRRRLVEFEQALAKGDWVKVKGELGSEWLSLEGSFRVEPDGSIMQANTEEPALLVYRGRVGRNFEVRGTFTVESPTHQWQNFGVALGLQEPGATDWINCAVFQYGGRTITFDPLRGHHGYGGPDLEKVVTLAESNRFLLRSRRGLVTFILNDQTLLEDFQPPEGQADLPAGQFGFSSVKSALSNTTKITDIEVRRLPAK